jgi:hypothetical protein
MTRGFQHTFPSIARVVLKQASIVCGLGVMENAYDQTAKIADPEGNHIGLVQQ